MDQERRKGAGRVGGEARVKWCLYMSPVKRQTWAFSGLGAGATIFWGGLCSVPASKNRFLEVSNLKKPHKNRLFFETITISWPPPLMHINGGVNGDALTEAVLLRRPPPLICINRGGPIKATTSINN
jgi:hypothetical protein